MLEAVTKAVEEAEKAGSLTPEARIDLLDLLLEVELPDLTDDNAEEVEGLEGALQELFARVDAIEDDQSDAPVGVPDPRFPTLGDPRTGVFLVAQAEQNGALTGGRMNFSFGNGNEHKGDDSGGWGLIVPFNGLEIVAMTVGSRVGADGNGASIGLVVVQNPSKAKAHKVTDMVATLKAGERVTVVEGSVMVDKGQAINFITDNPGGDDLVVSVWGRWV